jgi:hypothetical protein
VCNNTAGLITIPFIFGWVMGAVYNKISIQNPVKIPHKNSFLTALAVVAATYFSLLAMQKTSFPVVIMF